MATIKTLKLNRETMRTLKVRVGLRTGYVGYTAPECQGGGTRPSSIITPPLSVIIDPIRGPGGGELGP